MASLEEIRQERLAKLARLRESGIDPYPIEVGRTLSIADLLKRFQTVLKSKKTIKLVGRIRAMRGQGGVIFIDFNDGTASLQGLLKKDELSEAIWRRFNNTVDLGDLVELKGNLFVTNRQEKTLLINDWKMLAKTLRPLPDKWHGLQDIEERFRRRYLDSLMDGDVRERFFFRSRLIKEIRQILDDAGFLEVETPILQTLAGGASAVPFVTHHQALSIDLTLRVSPELYLKKMLIGGYPKVYELSRNFRNEGVDATHNPEFTMLEFYEAWSNALKQRTFIESILRRLVRNLLGGAVITYDNQQIDFTPDFKVISYFDLLKRYALIPNPELVTRDELTLKANQFGLTPDKTDSSEKLMDQIYKKICRPKIIQPTFIIHYPKNYLPLAKSLPNNPELVDAFQLVIGGLEIAKAFSELNDPLDQLERFKNQEKARARGDDEAQPNDQDFIEALEYGMPPAGGVGIGIDRLTMLLTDTHNIKEVIFFPTLRPK